MRLLGMLLALGAIAWLLYTAAGGEDAETVIPESYQQSMDKARGVEDMVNEQANKQLQAVDGD
ncbi:MAG: hypothetical protein ACK2U9_20770 [Anaerolineae bacterium]